MSTQQRNKSVMALVLFLLCGITQGAFGAAAGAGGCDPEVFVKISLDKFLKPIESSTVVGLTDIQQELHGRLVEIFQKARRGALVSWYYRSAEEDREDCIFNFAIDVVIADLFSGYRRDDISVVLNSDIFLRKPSHYQEEKKLSALDCLINALFDSVRSIESGGNVIRALLLFKDHGATAVDKKQLELFSDLTLGCFDEKFQEHGAFKKAFHIIATAPDAHYFERFMFQDCASEFQISSLREQEVFNIKVIIEILAAANTEGVKENKYILFSLVGDCIARKISAELVSDIFRILGKYGADLQATLSREETERIRGFSYEEAKRANIATSKFYNLIKYNELFQKMLDADPEKQEYSLLDVLLIDWNEEWPRRLGTWFGRGAQQPDADEFRPLIECLRQFQDTARYCVS